jgi:hypothetical protein
MVGTEWRLTAGRQIGLDGYVGALHQRGARNNRRGRGNDLLRPISRCSLIWKGTGQDTSDGAPRAGGQGG